MTTSALDLNTVISGVKILRSWSTKNEEKEVAKMSAGIDFEGITLGQLCELACQPLIIRRQAIERKLSVEEIESSKGSTIHWSQMGLKIKSREEKIQEIMSAGLPRTLAERAVDDPQGFKALMNSMK